MSDRRPSACILITGATGGLGAALALDYAAPGVTLILHGRDAARLAEVVRRCVGQGAAVEPWVFDLADLDALPGAVTALAQRHAIDLAILNAGVTSSLGAGGAAETWADCERVMAVNARAAMALATGLVPAMRRRRSGQIAFISSLSAWYGLGLTPAYCASKAALKAYGESLGVWLAPEGIAVSVVLPGFVRSAMSDRFPGPRPFLMSAEAAAALIRRGLGRGRSRIAFPQPLAFGMWGLAVLPSGLSRRILTWLGFDRP